MLGPWDEPPCEVRLASIRACTVRAICSALKRAEPDSEGGREGGRDWRRWEEDEGEGVGCQERGRRRGGEEKDGRQEGREDEEWRRGRDRNVGE